METQPPPGAPAPPPSEQAARSRKRFRAIVWLGVGSVVVLILAGVLTPRFIKSTKHGDFVRSLGNAKGISIFLIEFDNDYGKFPDATTIAEVRARTGTTLPLGTRSSNDYFRQLLAFAPAISSSTNGIERIFHVPDKRSPEPDGDILGPRALEKGECGWAYIPGLGSSSPTDTPVLIGPLLPGTDKGDPGRADGHVIVLCVDGSAREMRMDSHGHVMINGMRLLDPANPLWGGKPPNLVWPE